MNDANPQPDRGTTQASPDRRWLLVGDLPCLACEYNLRGLAGPVVSCPECGHANDLRNASRWRLRQLPLGVRDRQHWPASSAFFFFAMCMAGFLMIVFYFNKMPSVSTIFLAISAFQAWLWFWTCRRWVRSCSNVRWAIGVICLVHISSVLLLPGLIGAVVVSIQIIERSLEEVSPQPLDGLVLWAAACFPIPLVGIWWASAMLRRGEHGDQYRQSSRNWRVPTVEPDERK